jgi:hypothetical protein
MLPSPILTCPRWLVQSCCDYLNSDAIDGSHAFAWPLPRNATDE